MLWENQHQNATSMESRMHAIEIEAYGAVLRAFVAQSDHLSWAKEELISDLRKELRVSDVEHREILAKVNADESIKAIRALQEDDDFPREQITAAHLPRKKMKTSSASTGKASMRRGRNQRENASCQVSDLIEIHATEELIQEVERMCGGEKPDPRQVEKAKSMLREHERALVQAIARLAKAGGGD